MRRLAIVATCGLTVAVICIGVAAAIGVQDFQSSDFYFPLFDGPACGRADDGHMAASRTIPWDGADQVVLSVPGQARYAPGNDAMLHVSGNPALIAHIRVRDGHIELNCHSRHNNRGDVEIILPGRTFQKFAIAGSGRMDLDGLNQNVLKISIAGSGTIHANGHVKQLDVHIAGSGDADLRAVSADTARVHISGSGNVDVAPRNKADIHIAGSGDVILHSHPAQMDTHIAGSGRVRTAEDNI